MTFLLLSPTAVAAFASTALISLVPNLLLVCFPVLWNASAAEHRGGLWLWGQSLAAGGLLGDVFLHTLPHAMSDHGGGHSHTAHDDSDGDPSSHSHSHETGVWILVGFCIFFTVDLFLRMVEDSQSSSGGHSHHHHGKAEEKEEPLATRRIIKKKTAWSLLVLNVTADALHNFTDGLAIGASWSSAPVVDSWWQAIWSSRGSVATLSILLHEVPHELGDYCTLVAAGYTPWQAVRTQFVTAVAAFCGTAVALGLQTTEAGGPLILATAGGFCYLACTTLLPHVLNEPVGRPWHRLAHWFAFVVGLAFMYAVACLEQMNDATSATEDGHGLHDHSSHSPHAHDHVSHHEL
jgi:zinc transporter 7